MSSPSSSVGLSPSMGHTVSLYDKLMEAAAVHTLVSLKVFD